jgi:hypothetical protein
MNLTAVATLLAYFLIGGLAYVYGYSRTRNVPAVEEVKAQQATRTEAQHKEARAAKVPDDEPITIDIAYTEAAGQGSFAVHAAWGEWKTEDKQIAVQGGKAQKARIGLGWGTVELAPVFGSAAKGQYDVRITGPDGGLMCRFKIVETGKQVVLQDSPTPGYGQRLVFYEPERRVTTYRIVRLADGRRADACGVAFLGKGWSAVEESRGPESRAAHVFPDVQVMILPQAWMEGNEIGDVMKSLKRGKYVPVRE